MQTIPAFLVRKQKSVVLLRNYNPKECTRNPEFVPKELFGILEESGSIHIPDTLIGYFVLEGDFTRVAHFTEHLSEALSFYNQPTITKKEKDSLDKIADEIEAEEKKDATRNPTKQQNHKRDY